jgi:predicted ATPase with chaperone activity
MTASDFASRHLKPNEFRFSACEYHRVLAVARTLANLEGSDTVKRMCRRR